MADVWSFNTTVRNPERMENMLRALAEMEGVNFDATGQEQFFSILIQKRLYKPERSTLEEEDLILQVHDSDSNDDLSAETVERIISKYRGKTVDSSGRGRTPASVFNRFGLAVALQSQGPVVITPLGKHWLAHKIDDSELFTKFLLKWQYPNPIEEGYGQFDIKPFVGTLALITSVNKKWEALGNKPVGLSRKDEYPLFVPSLIRASQIEEQAELIIQYRNQKRARSGNELKEFIQAFAAERIQEIYGPNKNLITALSDLQDYTDSSLRYFRTSDLIALRGEDTHIDISKDHTVEVASILSSISVNAKEFFSYEEYLEYLSDTNAVPLPWENETDLKRIVEQLSNVLKTESPDTSVYITDAEMLPIKDQVAQLEARVNQVRIEKLKSLRYDLDVLDECIAKLAALTGKKYETLTARPSLDLEWYVSRALMVLNDAVQIAPSYKIGDDGIPTGFRANVPDISCYYKTFSMTAEVTLLVGRDQSYAEGQPVMRHLRDFEDSLDEKSVYCLFIAPHIHRDTCNSFWGSNTFGFETKGRTQNIVPLTIAQFIEVLKVSRQKIQRGLLTHEVIKNLLDSLLLNAEEFETSESWTSSFPERIHAWSNT